MYFIRYDDAAPVQMAPGLIRKTLVRSQNMAL